MFVAYITMQSHTVMMYANVCMGLADEQSLQLLSFRNTVA